VPTIKESLRTGSGIAIARHLPDLRVLENRGVEVHRLFGLIVEPEKGSDFLHETLLLFALCQKYPNQIQRVARNLVVDVPDLPRDRATSVAGEIGVKVSAEE
jgi:hypothetical protein